MIETLEYGLKSLYDIGYMLYEYEDDDDSFYNQSVINEVEKCIDFFDVGSVSLSESDWSQYIIGCKSTINRLLENGHTHLKTYKLKEEFNVLDLPKELLVAIIDNIHGESNNSISLVCVLDEIKCKHDTIKELEKEKESLNKTIEDMVRIIAELNTIIKAH